jgi:RHS repeat-associated protein
MGLALLWGRGSRVVLAAVAIGVAMVFGLGIASRAQAAESGESAGVRSELANLVRSSSPELTEQTRHAAPPRPEGKLVPRYTTAQSQTYELPDGVMATWTSPSSANSAQASPMASGVAGSVTPLVTTFPSTCTLSSTTPTRSSCGQTTMTAGYESSSKTTTHALIEFNPEPYINQDETVLWSEFDLYVQKTSTTNATSVGAYPVTTAWEPGATWDTTNGSTSWHTPGGDFSTGSEATINAGVGGSTGWVDWYMPEAVQKWVNGTNAPSGQGLADYGFLVKQSTDGSTNNVLTFASPTEGNEEPKLVTYWIPRGMGTQTNFTQLPIKLTDKSSLAVNAASGNLTVENQNLQIAGRGVGFESERRWNSFDSEFLRTFGMGTTENNRANLLNWPDGSVSFISGSGAWFQFHKQGSSFITPAGIDATMCAAGSPKPCPSSLPSGTAYRLIYNQSQTFIDFNPSESGQLNTPRYIQDRYGNTLTYNYPKTLEDGWHSVTDTEGRKIEYGNTGKAFKEDELTNEITDVNGSRSTHYEITGSESEPFLTKYTDANGKQTTYGYTDKLLTSITTPAGKVTKLEYDSDNRVTHIIQTDNAEHTKGPTTTFTYYPAGSAPSPCTSKQKATVVKDPDGNDGESGHKTTYCANVLDEVEQTVDASGNATESSYNPLGNLISTTAAAPGTGESGDVESLDYDETGQNLECVVTGTSSKTSSCPTRPDKSALVTSYSYKDNDNPFFVTKTENPEGHSTFACYNHGEQAESEGHKCPASEAEQPAESLQNENDPLSSENELKFSYNKNGTIKSSTDADGHETKYEYDEKGNLKKIIPPAGSGIEPTTITVDADSRPHIITDGAGHIETITYDKDDRITEIAYTGTGTAKTVKFEYDADGNLIKREDPTGTTKYTVDPLDRITKEELPGGLSNSYEYDDASNMTAFTDGGGKTEYKYNGLNELESMIEPGEKKTTFAYDNDHRLKKITYPSGAIESYKLEPSTGRPETVTAEGVTGTTVPKLTYAYKEGENDTSLIQSLTESTGNTTSYVYDKLERLTEAKTAGTNPSFYKYTLDGAGNRTKQVVNLTKDEETGGKFTYYDYNKDNELECRQTISGSCTAADELSTYTYDKAGEELEIVPKSDTSGTTFAYNAAAETSSITPSGSGAETLSYGGTGQDDLTALGSSTTLQNSLLGITREVNSAGTSYFARTPTGLLIDERTPSGDFNPLYDGQGDIIGLVNSSKKVERTFRYGPYGENTKSEGTQTIPDPFGYKGGYRMPGGNKGEGSVANGLYHFGARYYDPTTGRWTQQDPENHLGSATQGDRFLFAGSDPINKSDPFGESESSNTETCEAVGGGIGVVVSASTGLEAAGIVSGGAFAGGCELGAGENEDEGSEGIVEEILEIL